MASKKPKKPKVTKARLLVRYGSYRTGDIVTGELAQVLVVRGQAKNMTPSPDRKARKAETEGAPENKAETEGAPENKGDDFNPEE